ncbi:hypothetical protein DL98DRAFT_142784 [Cadophora sp. DSE1049]|nr:hypothetical protein DL98DRAFT_142784 [Cadophora sp. DSE1049]
MSGSMGSTVGVSVSSSPSCLPEICYHDPSHLVVQSLSSAYRYLFVGEMRLASSLEDDFWNEQSACRGTGESFAAGRDRELN